VILTNNHESIVEASLAAALNDRVCVEHSGRHSEYSTAVRALVVGEIINLSAQFAALRDLVKVSQGDPEPMTDALRKEACRIGLVPCGSYCTAFARRRNTVFGL
jgi:hypothetical protein